MVQAFFFSADDDITLPIDECLRASLFAIAPHGFAHSEEVCEHGVIVNELATGPVEVVLDHDHVDRLERIPIAHVLAGDFVAVLATFARVAQNENRVVRVWEKQSVTAILLLFDFSSSLAIRLLSFLPRLSFLLSIFLQGGKNGVHIIAVIIVWQKVLPKHFLI